MTARAALLALCAGMALAGGCASGDKPQPGGQAPVVTAGPPYADAAAKHNANVKSFTRLFGYVVVQMKYLDKHGEKHEEQGEGRVQIIQPDHVAVSVGKVGETFFWLGSDSQRYWWLDLTGKQRVMFTGAHETYARSQARRVGVVVAPLDLVRLIGVVPLPATGGQAQVSADGTRVGIVTTLDNGGRQRIWVDPRTYLPLSVELFNANGDLEIVSRLGEPDGVDITGVGSRPLMNQRIEVTTAAGDAQITLRLSELQDGAGRMVPETFDARALARHYRVDTIIDLDAPPPPPPPPAR